MPDSAYQNVQAFHSWHSNRTYEPGNPQIDPWLRDVLVSLQNTLNLLAKQIDDNTRRIQDIETFLNARR